MMGLCGVRQIGRRFWPLKAHRLRTGARPTLRLALYPIYFSMIAGCSGTSDKPAEKQGVTVTAQGEGVSMTLSATPGEVEVSQPVRVELEIVAKPGVSVRPEQHGHKLTENERAFEYRVIRSEERVDEPTNDGGRRWWYRYELELFVADRHELPAAKLSYATLGGQGEGQSLETESLAIEVREPAAGGLTPEELKKITVLDPLELPTVPRWWWAAALACLPLIVWLMIRSARRRRLEAEIVIPVPPHEWAYGEIARLLAENLVARNLMQEYFYGISGIVRGYIERRFEVSAPEMTTEEFLSAAVRDPRFDVMHHDELARFLTECDLVKYARHEPTSKECDGVLQAARRFIEQTRERRYAPSEGAGPSNDGSPAVQREEASV